MDPYAVSMMPSTSMAIHISLLYTGVVAHLQPPFLNSMVLWSIHIGCCWAHSGALGRV